MNEKLFADDPITDVDEDKLNRGLFAQQVAKVCDNVARESSSSVVSLVGPWGSGKTSILNLVSGRLLSDGWSVATFNPWLFSDPESLMKSFFDEVISAIPTEKEENVNLRLKLGGYAKAVSPLGKFGGIFGVDGTAIIQKAGELIEGDQSLSKKREELIKELEGLEKPILVILDDLDRLYPEELLMIFKIVRLVGRLPNLHYLLSYDEDTLLDVISQTDLSRNDTSRARSYLEKMVQVRLDLPMMNSAQQLKLVNSAHNEVLERSNITMDDEDTRRVSNAYAECMVEYLSQPRAIKRFFAQIDALYPLVEGEVNFADFTLLTFLRTFEPGVYQLIIERKQEITGTEAISSLHEESLSDRKERWLSLLGPVVTGSSVEKVFNLLSHLFIHIKSARGNATYTSDSKEERLQKRAGNADYFDRYFVLGVPEEDISDSKVAKLLHRLDSGEDVAKGELGALIGSNPSLALRKISSIHESAGVASKPLLTVMADKYITLGGEHDPFAMRPEWLAQEIVKNSIQVIEPPDKKLVFEEISKSLSGLVMLIDTYIWRDEDRKELDQELREVIVEALKARMNDLSGKKLEEITSDDYRLLYPYKVLVGDEAITDWLWAGVEAQGWNPIDILAHQVGEATSFGSEGTRRTIGRIDSEVLDNYFGLDRLLELAKDEIEAVDLSEGSVSHRDAPTFDNKRNYVLGLLKARYDARNQEAQ